MQWRVGMFVTGNAHRVQHAGRPAHIHGGRGPGAGQQVIDGGDAAVFVVGPHGHPIGCHRHHLVQEWHVFAAAADIDCAPIGSALLRCLDHRQHGCHTDAADHEQRVVLGRAEIERIAGTLERQRVTRVESLVHLDRTATAVGDPAHGDAVVRAAPGRTTQRVLPPSARGQRDVDVRAGRPGWEQSAVGIGQRQGDHVGGDELSLGDHRRLCTRHRPHPRRRPPRRRG